MFKMYDKDHSGELHLKEFMDMFLKLMEKPTIQLLWDQIFPDTEVISFEDFTKFKRDVQMEADWTDEHSSDLFERLQCRYLTRREFQRYMSDPSMNAWFVSKHMNEVYQDMNQPLCHYYIASSHNTYLSGSQVSSESKTEMYRNVLNRGCRCVELDCWDGDNNEPVIWHGGTLTTKILFRDVIHTINKCAFEHNPYPVVLSLEVHTSGDQQVVMAEHIREIFGSRLAEPFNDETSDDLDFTPETLREKFLIKWKPPRLGRTESQLVLGQAAIAAQTPALVKKEAEEQKVLRRRSRSLSYISASPDSKLTNLVKANEERRASKPQPQPQKAPHSPKCERAELTAVVWMKARAFNGWCDAMQTGRVCDCTSYNEKRAEFILRSEAQIWAEANKYVFSRVYPGALRLASDNFNPVPFWNAGCQLVALNYQTADFGMRINECKFMDNAKCGYLLKPEYLRKAGEQIPKDPEPWSLSVRVIHGVRIPGRINKIRIRGKTLLKLVDIVDPYVQVFLTGYEEDTKKCSTNVVYDNGWDPTWNELFSFTIKYPELCFLTLRVMDKEKPKDVIVAEGSIALTSLMQGYRVVPLYNVETGTPIVGASLFCWFAMHKQNVRGLGNSAFKTLAADPALII